MNETIETLLSHRSIRAYADEPVGREDIELAVRAGQAAATSSAVQAYSCVRVTDPGVRARLAEIAGPQEKVRVSPELFVICGDTRRLRAVCERAGETYTRGLEGFLVSAIDAALFAQNMVVALESMGYGTCYIGGLRNDVAGVREALELPEGVYPVFGLCVGKPAEDPGKRPRLGVGSVLIDGAYPGDDEVLAGVDAYDEVYRDYLRERGAPEGAQRASWSGAMAGKLGRAIREGLAGAYRAMGARLD